MADITSGTEDELWAEIYRLRAAIKGPDDFATWNDAAVAERVLRVKAVALAEIANKENAALRESLATAVEIMRMADANGYGLGKFGIARNEFIKEYDAALSAKGGKP